LVATAAIITEIVSLIISVNANILFVGAVTMTTSYSISLYWRRDA
jgi:hypothetical protein